MKNLGILFFAFGILLFASCGKDPGGDIDNPGHSGNLTGINKWVYEKLEGWYYWNDAVKAAGPASGSLPYDEFLEATILSLRGAQDDSESPPTMDGGYDGGKRHIYSNITRTPAATRASKNEETGFGFDVKLFSNERLGTLELLVSWVQPNTPAARAGLKRGMWITHYNSIPINTTSYIDFWYRLHQQQGGTIMTLTDEGGNTYNLEATTISTSPILHYEVMTRSGGRRVAYLLYNHFEQGEIDRNDIGDWDWELRRVFEYFKAQGANRLVVDLRYNPGGAVASCQILSSLAGKVTSSQTFAKLFFNDEISAVKSGDNPEIISFRNETNSMGLDKVYVLATKDSASASEMFINSLRGVGVEVVHIGTTTEGKNVGMNVLTHSEGGYDYEFSPITFKIMNAQNYCDYAGGMAPNLYKEEFWDVTHAGGSGIIHELGDEREWLLAAALTLIDGGSVSPDTSTRGAETTRRPVTTHLRDTSRGGARIYEHTHSVPL